MLATHYDGALRFAHDLYRAQARKETSISYIAHLMTVSALVIEHCGDEDRAIGTLLHDAAKIKGVCRRWTSSSSGSAQASPKSSPIAPTPERSRSPNGALFDHRVLGDDHWRCFTGGAEGTRWYYEALDNFFARAIPGSLSDRLKRATTKSRLNPPLISLWSLRRERLPSGEPAPVYIVFAS
jgi:hypothetical protein